jgi:hypothetical protein
VAVAFLGINHHAGHDYLRSESLAQWLAAEVLLAAGRTAAGTVDAEEVRAEGASEKAAAVEAALQRAAECQYRLGDLAEALADEERRSEDRRP